MCEVSHSTVYESCSFLMKWACILTYVSSYSNLAFLVDWFSSTYIASLLFLILIAIAYHFWHSDYYISWTWHLHTYTYMYVHTLYIIQCHMTSIFWETEQIQISQGSHQVLYALVHSVGLKIGIHSHTSDGSHAVGRAPATTIVKLVVMCTLCRNKMWMIIKIYITIQSRCK